MIKRILLVRALYGLCVGVHGDTTLDIYRLGMEGLSVPKALVLTWKAFLVVWALLRIVVNLVFCVVGIAVVLLSIAVMAVSVMRVFLPRT
jgi:hypothetical protein